MQALNSTLDNIQAVLAFLTGIVMLIVVCGPMNPRKIFEKVCLLSIAISLVGAALRRLAKFYAFYDYDGSTLLLAEAILLIARANAVICGVVVIGQWALRCHRRKLMEAETVVLFEDHCDRRPAGFAKITH